VIARLVKLVLAEAALALLVFGTQGANAGSLVWNLQNVTFVDGGIASGSFVLNTDPLQNRLDNFDVKVTGGRFPSYEYSPQNSVGSYGYCSTMLPPGGCPLGYGTRVLLEPKTDSDPPRKLFLRIPPPATLIQSGTYRLNSTASHSYYTDTSSDYDLNYAGQSDLDVKRWVRDGSLTTGIPQPLQHGPLVEWSLDNIKFDNGGTATGSFVYDRSNGNVVDFNVQTNQPPRIHSFTYSPNFPCGGGGGGDCAAASVSPGQIPGTSILSFRTEGIAPSQYYEISLTAGGSMTDKGGILPLISGNFDYGYAELHSSLILGSLIGSPIPEMTPALFVAVGLIMLVASPVQHNMMRRG